MKKIICIALAMVMLLALSACGGNDNSSNNGDKTPTTPAPTTRPVPPPVDVKPIGYRFTYNDYQIGLNIKMDQVVELIGEANDSNTSDSCAFGGTDTTYYYDSFRITTSDDRGFEWVYQITLTDDMVSTEEGICIGSTAAEVTAAYGQSEGDTDAKLIYSKDGMRLEFAIKNGTVSAIRYTML